MAGLYNSDVGLLLFGTLCIAGAIWINKEFDKIIIDTVSISLFLIGFTLLGLGFSELKTNENISVSSLSYFMLFVGYRSELHAILYFCLIINGSILALIVSNRDHDLIHIYVSVLALIITYFILKEAKIITARKAYPNFTTLSEQD